MSLNDIAIVGAGGFGRETALLIKQINKVKPIWNFLGFYDDADKLNHNEIILGKVNDLQGIRNPLAIVIAVADPVSRKALRERITNPAIRFPSLIHPNVLTGDDQNVIGEGCILTAGCILTTHIRLGDFVIVNLLTSIGHDVVVGSYSSIMPNVSISGFVKIGECCFLGSGARILQNLSIGGNAVVGAGAVVNRSVEQNATVVGVPATKLQS